METAPQSRYSGYIEVLQGYTLFDHEGTILFDLGMQDHSDASFMGVAGDECFPGMHASDGRSNYQMYVAVPEK